MTMGLDMYFRKLIWCWHDDDGSFYSTCDGDDDDDDD